MFYFKRLTLCLFRGTPLETTSAQSKVPTCSCMNTDKSSSLPYESCTPDMVKSCWHSKTARGGIAQQLGKRQESQHRDPEWRSPSQALHLCPGSCSAFLTTQQWDNLWSWHTHCLARLKDLFNCHRKRSLSLERPLK